MASHGLLKRLPYRLETSPSPANCDYVGACSSWSGAHLRQDSLPHDLMKQFSFQSQALAFERDLMAKQG
jgi:hypothetical protein